MAINSVFSFADDNNDDDSQRVLSELENIDDECDALGITFVKLDDIEEAKEYGIEDVPALLYFEKGIPTVYEGSLEDEETLLKWLEQQTTSDEIEDITDEMLDLILEKMPHVAVLFCKRSFVKFTTQNSIFSPYFLSILHSSTCVLCCSWYIVTWLACIERARFFLSNVLQFKNNKKMIEIKKNQPNKQNVKSIDEMKLQLYPILQCSSPDFSHVHPPIRIPH